MNIKNEVMEIAKADLKTIDEKLEAQALDGNPFLLAIDHEDGLRIYGEWDSPMGKIRGFQAAELVPTHLCGTIQMSEESVTAHIERMTASGTYPAKKIHWREFLQMRKARLEALVVTVTAA